MKITTCGEARSAAAGVNRLNAIVRGAGAGCSTPWRGFPVAVADDRTWAG